MIKKVGLIVLLVGLVLVGVGSYEGFEMYDKYLKDSNTLSLYTGVYKSVDHDVEVVSASANTILVTINNESYEFSLNGDYYENDLLNYKIKMLNQSLSLLLKVKKLKFFIKKNSIQY